MSSSFVVEGDPTSWKTSYVESAQNMFNKDVPVCVKASDREERIEELTIRILLGIKKHEHNAKVRGQANRGS